MRQFIGPGVVINIRVFVNNAGKVMRAEPVVRGGIMIDRLSMLAASAAREWEFVPAKRDGRTVDSETVVQFKFLPEQ
jgi:hypothetical protein